MRSIPLPGDTIIVGCNGFVEDMVSQGGEYVVQPEPEGWREQREALEKEQYGDEIPEFLKGIRWVFIIDNQGWLSGMNFDRVFSGYRDD